MLIRNNNIKIPENQTYSRKTQFMRDQENDSEEIV